MSGRRGAPARERRIRSGTGRTGRSRVGPFDGRPDCTDRHQVLDFGGDDLGNIDRIEGDPLVRAAFEDVLDGVTAAEHLPLVLDFLVRDRVAKPPIDPMGVTMGGKDEAWLYRESMRKTWLATEGMLEWLKPLAKSLKSKHRI